MIRRGPIIITFLVSLMFFHGIRGAQAQSVPDQKTLSQITTQTGIDEATDNLKKVQKILQKQPKEKQDAAAAAMAQAVKDSPDVSEDLKQIANQNPRRLLTVNPKKLKGPDLLGLNSLVQQVTNPLLVPVAVLPTGLKLVDITTANQPLVKAVMAKAPILIQKARSVGRIEISEGGAAPQLVGTAFVVGSSPGYVMTACHVAKEIAHLDGATNTWQLNTGTYIDFGTDADHTQAKEFVVDGISSMSTIRGFDIAILKTETKSRDGSASWPPSLDLALQELNKQAPIAIIGFPDFNDLQDATALTKQVMDKIKAATPDTAKYISPGQVLKDVPRTSFHILVHIGSTHEGNSGSPVFSLDTVQVVGIHYCCTGPDGSGGLSDARPAPGDTNDCSSISGANIYTNEAISAVDARVFIPTVAADSNPAGEPYVLSFVPDFQNPLPAEQGSGTPF